MRQQRAIKISDDARKRALASIRRYFLEELEMDIGDLKADLILDYVLQELGPTIYNQGIADAQAFFEERSADLAALTVDPEFPRWDRKKR